MYVTLLDCLNFLKYFNLSKVGGWTVFPKQTNKPFDKWNSNFTVIITFVQICSMKFLIQTEDGEAEKHY